MRGGNGERKASERSSSEDDSWLADINLAERISQSPLVQWIFFVTTLFALSKSGKSSPDTVIF